MLFTYTSLAWQRDTIHCNDRKRSIRGRTGFHIILEIIYSDHGEIFEEIISQKKILFTLFITLSRDFLACLDNICASMSLRQKRLKTVFTSSMLSRDRKDPFDIY